MDAKKKKYGAIILCLIIGYLAQASTEWQGALFGRTVMGAYGCASGSHDCL